MAHSPEPPSEDLAGRAAQGDGSALDDLALRYLPRIRRWARGRLPRGARDLVDTDDLAQETLVASLRHLRGFEPRGGGAFAAYVRQALLNRLRDAARRAQRSRIDLDPPELDGMAAPGPSPLEEAIGREALERYETALHRLTEADQEAIVARLELDCTYEALAVLLGKPSADAARMATSRALVKLAREMGR